MARSEGVLTLGSAGCPPRRPRQSRCCPRRPERGPTHTPTTTKSSGLIRARNQRHTHANTSLGVSPLVLREATQGPSRLPSQGPTPYLEVHVVQAPQQVIDAERPRVGALWQTAAPRSANEQAISSKAKTWPLVSPSPESRHKTNQRDPGSQPAKFQPACKPTPGLLGLLTASMHMSAAASTSSSSSSSSSRSVSSTSLASSSASMHMSATPPLRSLSSSPASRFTGAAANAAPDRPNAEAPACRSVGGKGRRTVLSGGRDVQARTGMKPPLR
jgi:hypothetical protein